MTETVEPHVANFDTDESISATEPASLRFLEAVDWDFPDRISHSDIEGIHPYPAKFIAELPGAILDALPVPHGTAVLDPFCGSGSALVECQRRGHKAIGIDVNPIACLISRVKTAPCPESIESHAKTVVETAQQCDPVIPEIPNLNHWFEPSIQIELARLTLAIDNSPASMRDCMRMALSSIIVRVSNQDSDTRYAAVEKDVEPKMVATLFLRAVERLGVGLRSRDYPLTPVKVIEADTLAVTPKQLDCPVGLVVTSPPYPNAYEYWLYHKYRMWWLGYDPLSVKAQEIGARAHFFKKNHHTAEDFVRQMEQTFSLLDNVVVDGGFVAFVVGRSRIHGRIVDNAQIIEDVSQELKFRPYFSTERVLSPNRKSFNLSHANIKKETVLILRKECS